MASGPISFAEAATAGSWMAPGNIAWPIDATPWSGPYWDAAEYWTGPDMDMTDLFSRVSTVCHRIYIPHNPLFNVISDPIIFPIVLQRDATGKLGRLCIRVYGFWFLAFLRAAMRMDVLNIPVFFFLFSNSLSTPFCYGLMS